MVLTHSLAGIMTEERSPDQIHIAIIGAGLVGSLCACYLGKRGYKVDVYEYRKDIRKTDVINKAGRTINLALSYRGIVALKGVGLDEFVITNHCTPMRGRMIHTIDGKLNYIPYDIDNKCIYSVDRKDLNETLITAAEKYTNVKFFFEHRLVHIDMETNGMEFEIEKCGQKSIVAIAVDHIIGADGAYSTVRREMMKQPMFHFSQTYIEHGYIELCIPPTENNEFSMPENYLHIWPRNSFMMIALPNKDKSWTVSLFMPLNNFSSINSPKDVIHFFEKYFPDAIPLIGIEKLIHDYFATKPSTLISIKCKPYNRDGKCLIIGDAAHAMCPFFAQGMNSGFEDCILLDELLSQYESNISKVLPKFSSARCEDASAMCDLAMYNYIEMRDLVNRRSFLLRKKIDNVLYRIFRDRWKPLYNCVTFSRIKYIECKRMKEWQDLMLKRATTVLSGMLVITLGIVLTKIIN